MRALHLMRKNARNALVILNILLSSVVIPRRPTATILDSVFQNSPHDTRVVPPRSPVGVPKVGMCIKLEDGEPTTEALLPSRDRCGGDRVFAADADD